MVCSISYLRRIDEASSRCTILTLSTVSNSHWPHTTAAAAARFGCKTNSGSSGYVANCSRIVMLNCNHFPPVVVGGAVGGDVVDRHPSWWVGMDEKHFVEKPMQKRICVQVALRLRTGTAVDGAADPRRADPPVPLATFPVSVEIQDNCSSEREYLSYDL